MRDPLNIPCRVCGKLDSHCWSQVPVPADHIRWLRENTAYDGRRLSECKTHEDRCSVGHPYIMRRNGRWDQATYDYDGIEFTFPEPSPRYRAWLRRFRRTSPAVLASSGFSL